jgi:chromosomal replication initiation ATPase DnaA
MCDLTNLVWDKEDMYTPQDLLERMCNEFNIPIKDVCSFKRSDKISSYLRQAFCAIAVNEFPSTSILEIGKVIRRDHSTVSYYIKSVMEDPKKFKFYMKMKNQLKN